MDVGLPIALVALTGSMLNTVVTVLGAPTFQARRDANKALERYREPLLLASYELQARLHNILRNDFLAHHVVSDEAGKRQAALDSTLYVFAQFFGWHEIIRREIQFLRFSTDRETREVTRLLRDISETFLTDEFGPQFMIWRAEQRGLGERVIVESGGNQSCMGYATFVAERAALSYWFDPLERDLQNIGPEGRERLTRLQHSLLELVRRLDKERTRYPFELFPA